MNNTVQMGSVAMIYISSFINTVSGIHKLIGGDSNTYRMVIRSH
jgi:hypothetical protein